MINEEDYEKVKSALFEVENLFVKLQRVTQQFNELEYDESGFCLEEEEILQRHWEKLSSKIVDAIAQKLEGYTLNLYKNENLAQQSLHIAFVQDTQESFLEIDYSESGALSISQKS